MAHYAGWWLKSVFPHSAKSSGAHFSLPLRALAQDHHSGLLTRPVHSFLCILIDPESDHLRRPWESQDTLSARMGIVEKVERVLDCRDYANAYIPSFRLRRSRVSEYEYPLRPVGSGIDTPLTRLRGDGKKSGKFHISQRSLTENCPYVTAQKNKVWPVFLPVRGLPVNHSRKVGYRVSLGSSQGKTCTVSRTTP